MAPGITGVKREESYYYINATQATSISVLLYQENFFFSYNLIQTKIPELVGQHKNKPWVGVLKKLSQLEVM